MFIFQRILFIAVIGIAGFLLYKRIKQIRNNIHLGRDQQIKDNPSLRWKNVLLIALGQKKMFSKPIPAILHLMLYVGFLVINIEVLEFIIDGFTGIHRTFAHGLAAIGGTAIYTIALNIFEFLAILVILSCAVFLVRRNILIVGRFSGLEMTRWPKLDANLILIFEIVLMFAILTMNAADQVLQSRNVVDYPQTGLMVFSDILILPFIQNLSSSALVILERIAWWLHIIGILAFAIYITYSKHLHIFMSFINTYYARLAPMGKMMNMPEVTNEVKMMLGMPVEGTADAQANIPRLGAKDVNDLSWKNIMDAYTCTECGRCTAQCPANITGKKLSPRKIVMDVRDRAEEVGASLAKGDKGLEDGKSLLGDYISKEEILACTSCNACVEACPVLIDPLSIILQIRRYMAMEESSSPQSWNSMFSNIETNFAPWKFAPSDRFNWSKEIKPTQQNTQGQ